MDGTHYWLDPTRAPQKGRLEMLGQSNYGHALVIADFWTLDAKRPRHEAQFHVPELKALLQSPQNVIRQMPLGLTHPVEFEHVIEIRLPEDWQVEPRTERVDDPAFELVRKVEATPRVVTLTDRFRSLADHVEADRIGAYATQIEKARQALDFSLYYDRTPEPTGLAGLAAVFNWAVALLALCAGVLWWELARRCYRWEPPGRPTGARCSGRSS